MYDGDKAVLTMVQYLKEDKEKDENIYEATVIEYQKEMEQVHLILRSGSLSDISLDAVYECRIRTITCETVCTGMIKERYENRAGMILVLQVTNGFYEIKLGGIIMKLEPLADRVVLKQLVAEETTKSGIVLPGQSKEKPQQAEVVAVGPGGVVDGKEVTMNVSVGDKVIYSKYAGTEVELDDEEYIIVKQNDILAVIR